VSSRSVGAASKHQLFGIAFLALLLMFVYLTYAIFTKKFVDFVPVRLKTSTVGLQLPALADVKIRGLLVGDVRRVQSEGDGAVLDLAIMPDEAHIIPKNVTARIVPKTLFGEKYVALQVPKDPSSRSIRAGDVISESHVAIEVEKVLSDLYPLLRTVEPAQLNYTLTALADALEGRGEKLGQNLVTLDGYLKRMNPKIPLLVDDLGKLATVSDTYAEVVPELANVLRNSVTTGQTFVEKEQKVKALFDDVAGFSRTSKDFLETNGDNIIRLSKQGQAQLPLFAKYAPEYPCLIEGLDNQLPRLSQQFRDHTLHINLEVLPNMPTGYTTADSPKNGAHNGPHCSRLPNPPYSQHNRTPQPPVHTVDDGVSGGHGKFRPRAATGFDLSSGYAGSGAERSLVNSLVGPSMGVPVDEVPDVASLLMGPLARGTEVSVG
jgi:phospholipid/cholesterol/gamma-HCH transport system substrate-binding protein